MTVYEEYDKENDEEYDEEYEYDPENCIDFMIDDSQVILDGPEKEVVIEDIHLYYRKGVWCEKDEENDCYMPDWDLTWFYEDKNNPQNYFYFEQDPPEIAIHNLKNTLIRLQFDDSNK